MREMSRHVVTFAKLFVEVHVMRGRAERRSPQVDSFLAKKGFAAEVVWVFLAISMPSLSDFGDKNEFFRFWADFFTAETPSGPPVSKK